MSSAPRSRAAQAAAPSRGLHAGGDPGRCGAAAGDGSRVRGAIGIDLGGTKIEAIAWARLAYLVYSVILDCVVLGGIFYLLFRG